MIAFLLALFCFLISIPIQAIVMGYKLKQKKGKSLFEKLTPHKASNLMDRLGVKKNKKDKDNKEDNENKENKNSNNSEEKTKEKAKKAIKEVVITALSAIVVFLRALAALLTTCGFFGLLLILIIVIVIISAIGGIIAILMGFSPFDIDLGGSGGSSQSARSQQESAAEDDYYRGPTQVFTDNSTWVNCCNSVYSWYFANIPTYCTKLPGEDGYGKTKWGRAFYPCELFPGTQGCGDDCSAYVSNALVYAGFLPASSVNCFVSRNLSGYHYNDSTDTWDPNEITTALDTYFNRYTYADYQAGRYIPRAGDIMAMKGHLEILAEITNTVYVYSWGKVQTQNPVSTGKSIDEYLAKPKLVYYYALKDDVIPPSYLKNADVKFKSEENEESEETEDEDTGGHSR